ncbi:MAG: double-strand break repair helicase AddA [Litorimonas sp.]
MSDTPFTVDDATRLQRDAADPTAPRMVNANAGSGKTKVLVDRVSRILLQGTDPDKILCLTYTRAAASEMQERLFATFSRWSIASDDALLGALHDLYGQPYAQVRGALPIDRVRTLFASALETPEGLKVMTIHAFCERIIARFPMEAGILPGFSPLDDRDADDLLAEGRTRLLEQAQADAALSGPLHRLARANADMTLDAMLSSGARGFERLDQWKRAGGMSSFRSAAGLAPDDQPEAVARAAWEATDRTRLQSVAALCRGAGKTAEDFAACIDRALAADADRAFEAYASAFFTGSGTPRKTLLVKAVKDADDFITEDSPETQRVMREVERLKAAKLAQMSEAYLTLAHALGADHQAAKHAARGLDFNDLILKTRDLLQRTEVSDWVAYKLDGGVEHVLLDEAQDTSPEQWQIIDSLTAPFAQDSPDRDGPSRTFFAVGDPKQSIYRFQGAAPKLFMDSIRARAADGKGVALRMSFRSAQHVLDAVDQLLIEQRGMQAMFDADSVPEGSDHVRHAAFRSDPGLVELWPLVPRAEGVEEKDPWDTTPVDAVGEGDPKVRLAREIAQTTKRWIEAGEPVFDRALKRHRPVHAGDVLILVQKRVGGLFDALIRELKRADLPVAGADRLVLQEATIVRDLLAVTRFVLLPGDCLSLAEALKSPLFGLDDDALFDIAVDRESASLWEALQTRRPDLAASLQAIRADGGLAPYDFYARLLDRRGPHGLTYREALFQRLGLEGREALDAFLATALAHQQRQAPSLQRFLQAFTADEVEIKRDKDPAGREVRIMTVHGAKGLEAPIVFLPDTTRAPANKASGLIRAGEGWILAPSSRDSIPLTDRYKAEHHAENMREYMRLLYVAMTRAESRLVICGAWHGRSKAGFAEESWYHWALRTMEALPTESFDTPFDGEGRQGLQYGERPAEAEATDAGIAKPSKALPDWIDRDVPPEPVREDTASPSALLAREEPLSHAPGGGRFMRGILIHRLLEILPDHPLARRRSVAEAMLAQQPELVGSDRGAILSEVFGVLDDPAVADVFAHGSRAEVSLAGRVETIRGGEVFLTAQVDRLHVTPDSVFLVDYKSNRMPPDDLDGVDPGYLAQMAAYRELARAVWPDRAVRCGLLWTAAPHLMWLPDSVMDAALTQVNDLPTSGLTSTEAPS